MLIGKYPQSNWQQIQEGTWGKENPYSLLVGLHFGAATKEIEMENSQKPKNILP